VCVVFVIIGGRAGFLVGRFFGHVGKHHQRGQHRVNLRRLRIEYGRSRPSRLYVR
jgi:hypothetical protein